MKTKIYTSIYAIGIALIVFGFLPKEAISQEPANPAPQVDASGFPIKNEVKKISTLMISMRPSAKRPLILRSQERNPYASRSEEQKTGPAAGVESEESRIRSSLGALSVTGSSRGQNNHLKVQMGDITLEEGRILPPLIADQTINLQVTELTEDSITLGWLDIETMELTGKTMQVAYDLSPKIMYQLSGQVATREGAGSAKVERKMGFMQIGKKRRVQAARIASKDPSRHLSREIREAAQ